MFITLCHAFKDYSNRKMSAWYGQRSHILFFLVQQHDNVNDVMFRSFRGAIFCAT